MKKYNMIMMYSVDSKKVLFCLRKKNPYIGKLNFPGGKVEQDESSAAAAIRELEEETGIKKHQITVMNHLIDFVYYDTGHTIEFYVCKLIENVEVKREEGGNELIWIDIENTDFSSDEFAGDGNILHCIRMAQKLRSKYYAED